MSFISACISDSDESPTALPTFSGSSNTMAHLWMLSDVGVIGKSKMAAINLKYIWVAVEFSSLTFLQAEIYDIAYVLPVDGGHH